MVKLKSSKTDLTKSVFLKTRPKPKVFKETKIKEAKVVILPKGRVSHDEAS